MIKEDRKRHKRTIFDIKQPLITIIIPHYNSSDLLDKLLSTIEKDKNIEVLVIDDKSEDEHIKNIQNIQKSCKYVNFRLLKNKTLQKGAGACRNIGLEHATGTWILFADADDYFTDNFYESISQYLESNNDVVFFMPTSIYIDTKKIADRHLYLVDFLKQYKNDDSSINELNLRYRLPPPWSKLIKKDFIDKNEIKFDEVLAGNDVMFSTKVGFFLKNFDISNNIIYVVTRGYGSLTMNASEEVFDARFQVFIRRYNFLKNRLSKEDFVLLNFSTHTRPFILKSMKYGIIKLFKTLIVIQKNDVKFFQYALLNPIFIWKKLSEYRKKLKKETIYKKTDRLEKNEN